MDNERAMTTGLTSPYRAFVFRGLVISCCVERTNDWSSQIIFQLDFHECSDESLYNILAVSSLQTTVTQP